jgi:signal transduction histidine kinase
MKEELTRLDRMLQVMLGENALTGGTPGSFDLREVLKDIATLLTPQARRQRVTLETQMPESAALVTGVRDRLKQALLNVAINALEAMPEGGRLGIRAAAEGGMVKVVFEDSGAGIPQELLDQVYQIYFTTKTGGSGIGLYVARLVAESHGGDIGIESAAGKGTIVRITLPLARDAAAP